MIKSRHIDWHDYLIEELSKDHKHAMGYLNLALIDDDPRMLTMAINNVIEAHLKASNNAKRAILKQKVPYINSGKPKLKTLPSLIDSLDIQMSFQLPK